MAVRSLHISRGPHLKTADTYLKQEELRISADRLHIPVTGLFAALSILLLLLFAVSTTFHYLCRPMSRNPP